jgi:dTDP-4-amino-4,6-dideoxy-D-galactose acyltransferase
MKIEYLKWDSEFFNIKIGSLNITDKSLEDIQRISSIQANESYDLLYIFSENYDTVLNKELQKTGAVLVDKKVTYHKTISGSSITNETVKAYSGRLTDELEELAYESGHKSRFKLDPRLNHKFKEMYKLWIENSLNGKMADRVFTTQEQDKITSFVTVKNKQGTGSIGLIAVSKQYQGKSIGKLLLDKTEEWYYNNNILRAEVVTQQDNIGACRFYEKNGYTVKNVQYIYHLWRK